MDHRVAWWNRWPVPFLLVGPAIGRSDRLHIWGDTNPDFIFRVVAAAASSFCIGSGLIRQRRLQLEYSDFLPLLLAASVYLFVSAKGLRHVT
jgi:hypothetical protein